MLQESKLEKLKNSLTLDKKHITNAIMIRNEKGLAEL